MENADAWLQHSTGYSDLLENLSKQYSNPIVKQIHDKNDSCSDSMPTRTLDESVKSLKSKIYYGKYLKGKDIKNVAKEDDFKKIFGNEVVRKPKKRKRQPENLINNGGYENLAFNENVTIPTKRIVEKDYSMEPYCYENAALVEDKEFVDSVDNDNEDINLVVEKKRSKKSKRVQFPSNSRLVEHKIIDNSSNNSDNDNISNGMF